MKAFKIATLILLTYFVSSSELFSQQLFRSTQYVFNPYLVNPAVAGTDVNTPIMASYRQQWAGFNGAPTTYTLSGHGSLVNSVGLGVIVFNDDAGGALSTTGAEITGAYKVDLNNDDQISFGLSAVISSLQFDNTGLEVIDTDDLELAAGVEQSTNFDANFGLMVYGSNYFYGFSINRLLQSDLGIGDNSVSSLTENENARHFNIMGSYDYDIDDKLTFQPSAMLRFTGVTPVQFDLHAKGIYQEAFWVGLSYRHQDAIAGTFGLAIGNFKVGYSYDITTTSAVRELSPHTHEINVGYTIPRADPQFKQQGGFLKKRYNVK
ncbi:MAG: type IX secretion system membrane protein PorP/SprF [Flavobacteriales bacterium]